MDVLFLQGGGAGAHDEDSKLAASLQKALGSSYTVYYPRMPDEDAPEYAAWRDRILEELSSLKGEVILAGHSLGASLLLKLLAEETPNAGVKGVFLAAAPYWGAPDWEVKAYALSEGFALPENLPLFFYHSRDDESVPFAHQGHYASVLPRATVRAFETGGHQFGDDLSDMAEDIQSVARAG